jgi:predicted  nucleic acid-binding Zn-ribbon protein
MAGQAAILREIHRLRRHAKDLQTEIGRVPLLLKAKHNLVAGQEEVLHKAQEDLRRLKVSVLEKEGLLRTTHQQIAKHQKQLNEISSKKEYDALQAEIASDKKKCQQLEDEILEGMTGTEERAARIPELEKALKRAREDSARFEQDAQVRQASLAEQLRQTQQQLKDVEATMSEDIRSQYERLVNARGEDAMAAVHNRTCSSCYTEITAQMYNDLLSGRFVLCKNCGRILYLPE